MEHEKLRKIIREILNEAPKKKSILDKDILKNKKLDSAKNFAYQFYFAALDNLKDEAYKKANSEYKKWQSKNRGTSNVLELAPSIKNFSNYGDFKNSMTSEPNPNLAKIPVSKRTRNPYNRTVLIPKADIFKEKTKDMGAYIDIATYIGGKEGNYYWTEEGLGWWEEEGHKMIDLFSEDDLVEEERFHLDKDTYYRLPPNVKPKKPKQ